MKTSKKTAFEAARRSIFMLAPEDVVIIGVDTEDGPNHPLYDERIHMPLNEATVLDIMKRGVKKAILVTKVGDEAVVTDGRRRVLHAREVNRRIREAGGKEFIRIPVMPPEHGTEGELMGLMIALNEHREADTPINRAKKIRRYLDMGYAESEVAQTFNVSESTVANLLSLLSLIPEAQTKLVQGEIGLTRAYEIAKLPREKQAAAIRERRAAKTVAQRGPSRATLKTVLENGRGILSKGFLLGLQYALGEAKVDDVPGLDEVLQKASSAE